MPDAESQKTEDVATLYRYRELCSSYRAIDDFRAKLLALLPIGTGLFLVVPELIKASSKEGAPTVDLVLSLSRPIALGLFSYELYGIRKYTHMIEVGKALEHRRFFGGGQFAYRAPAIGGFVSEPCASGVIYPAVMAGWTFLALRR